MHESNNEAERTVAGPQGAIPVPPDWTDAFQFDFLDYTAEDLSADTDPALWEFLKSEVDQTEIWYASPLSTEQMEALSQER